MYMVGLLPFGLAKLFSLFLYASHRHKKAAKIALYSLLTSVTFSLILIHPMGASGLALAGSLGGWVLFILTVREVGFEKFKRIIKDKRTRYFLTVMPLFAIVIYQINLWIMDIIR
jgi:putative peptidoglycan lipid II flippase